MPQAGLALLLGQPEQFGAAHAEAVQRPGEDQEIQFRLRWPAAADEVRQAAEGAVRTGGDDALGNGDRQALDDDERQAD